MGGAGLGLLAGAGVLGVMFTVTPSAPGTFELMILLGFVGVLAVGGSVVGFFVGLLIDLNSHKRQ